MANLLSRRNRYGLSARVPRWFALLLLVWLAAASPVGYAAGADSDWPAWFSKAMNKEKRVRRSARFVTPDGLIAGRMPGTVAGAPESGNGLWYLSSDIGADAEMECWIFADEVNTAFALVQMTDAVLKLTGEQNGGLRSRSLHAVDADHLDGRPVLATDWIYTAGAAPESQAGFLKMRAALIEGKTLVCAHNALGYRTTFSKAFDALVASLVIEPAQPQKRPYYSSLLLNAVDGQRVGFTRTEYLLDERGDTEIYVANVLLIPQSDVTLGARDFEMLSFSKPDGELVSARALTVENGQVVADLQLGRSSRHWVVGGTTQGQALDVQLDASGVLWSELGQALQIRDLQRRIRAAGRSSKAVAEATTLSLPVWLPQIDPTRVLPASVELGADAKSGIVAFGPISMSALFDRQGNLEQGVYVSPEPALSPRLAVERVWSQGELPDGSD